MGVPQTDDVASAVLAASRVLVAISARSLAAVEGTVTLPQFRALVFLHSRGTTNLNGIAADLEVNASTALRMVDRLVANGLVTREPNPHDRREIVLALSAQGRRLVQRVNERRRREIARVVDRMPTARRAALVAALEAFATAAGEPPAATW